MIVNITSCDELSHKQKTKIKYLAQDVIVELSDGNPIKDDTPAMQKRLMLELQHVFYQLDDVVNQVETSDAYKEDWFCLYQRYLDLIKRIDQNYSEYVVHKKHVPPYPEFYKWSHEQQDL